MWMVLFVVLMVVVLSLLLFWVGVEFGLLGYSLSLCGC